MNKLKLKLLSHKIAIIFVGLLMASAVGATYYCYEQDMTSMEQSLGANVISLQTDNAKAITSTDSGDKTSLDVAVNATYSTSTDTIENGETGSLRLDTNGNLLASMNTRLDETNDHVTTHEKAYSYSYVSAPTANTVVKATAGTLVRIILGAWVTGGTVECSDHATDGDGNVKIFLTAGATDESGFPKSVDIGANFSTGITCDTIGLTQVTFIYE